MNFTPNLIPHPGALSRVECWNLVQGYSEKYRFAPDYEYWLKIRKLGYVARVETPMSFFKWHSSGLTGGNRLQSGKEASDVRLANTIWYMRWLVVILNPVLIWIGEKSLKRAMKDNYHT